MIKSLFLSRLSNSPRQFVAVAGLAIIISLFAFDAGRAHGGNYALLIGVSQYDKLDKLKYTVNDVEVLAQTLENHGSFKVIKLSDQEGDKPNRANIADYLREFLVDRNQLDPFTRDDRVLVFYSGHGAKARGPEAERQHDAVAPTDASVNAKLVYRKIKDGGVATAGDGLYLCPSDFDPEQPERTGIPIQWVRDMLAECGAKTKIVILDSCHAGSEKAANEKLAYAPPSSELVEPFKGKGCRDVVTLASCSAKQASFMSALLKHSVFTYHLIEGLKGHADRDSDGSVDIDELFGYVNERVSRDVWRMHGREQTPRRSIGLGTPGVPTISDVRPMNLDELLEDMAYRLAYEISSHEELKGHMVIPLEFVVQKGSFGSLFFELDSGALGRFCAVKIGEHLKDAAKRLARVDEDARFEVKDASELQDRISRLNIETIRRPPPATIAQFAGTLLADGIIRSQIGPPMRDSMEITLSCAVRGLSYKRPVAYAGGKALIGREYAALGGWSMIVDRQDGPDAAPAASGEAVDLRHPLQDSRFPFCVALRVKNKYRPGKFVGNRLYVPVDKGEEYEIVVGDKRQGKDPVKDAVMMRLLVDGLNTLPQAVQEEFRAAPVVNLQRARAWILDEMPGPARKYTIRGFVQETGEGGGGRRFEVTDRESSLAARSQYTEQIGIITAAFYAPDPNTSRDVQQKFGTKPGREFHEHIRELPLKTGGEIAFVSLHYIDYETWNELSETEIHYVPKEWKQ